MVFRCTGPQNYLLSRLASTQHTTIRSGASSRYFLSGIKSFPHWCLYQLIQFKYVVFLIDEPHHGSSGPFLVNRHHDIPEWKMHTPVPLCQRRPTPSTTPSAITPSCFSYPQEARTSSLT